MTTSASPSILGLQRNRKVPSSIEVASAPVAAQQEPVPDSEEEPDHLPVIMVDPASAYAPVKLPQVNKEQPPMRVSPQLDVYHPYGGMTYSMGDGGPTHRHPPDPYHMRGGSPYLPTNGGMPSYPIGERVPAQQHFQPHNPYNMRTDPYLPTAGLAPPPQPFMHSQSIGPYMGPQRLGTGLYSNSSDWNAPGYSNTDSVFPGSRLQTPPIPRPLLPPKPIELASAGVPPSAISELPHPAMPNLSPKPVELATAGVPPLAISELPHPATTNLSTVTCDTIPSSEDRQTPLETQQDHQKAPLAGSPVDEALEALEPPDPFAPNKMPKPPMHIPDNEIQERPAASPKPTRGMGGRPTLKALGLIEQGFTKITAIIEGLAEATGKPPSDLYRRLEKSRKGSSEGHLWNIYLHYFARHEEEEAARVGQPLERNQAYRSLCYAQYKVDHENFQELLEVYHELEMADVEMTVGQRKREAEKYEKKLHTMVSQ